MDAVRYASLKGVGNVADFEQIRAERAADERAREQAAHEARVEQVRREAV